MALRIRKTGEILCAAHTDPEEGDTYIHDGIHYYMSVMTNSIIASPNHTEDNLWFWNIEHDQADHHKLINKDMKVTVRSKPGKLKYI
jgi:hypothetical protein